MRSSVGFALGLVLVGSVLAACSSNGARPNDAPASESSQTMAPTQKSLDPTGPNKFTPTQKAKPAPTALPGNVRGGS